MTRRRRSGLVGLGSELADETKRFADARWPYPIERNTRGIADAVVSGDDRGPRIERHLRGIGWAVLDDGLDQAEQEERAELAEIRDALAELQAAVDRIAAERRQS